MRNLKFLIGVICLSSQVTFSQPAFTSIDEIKVSQSPADDSPPSIAVNNDGSVWVVWGNASQWFYPDLSRDGEIFRSSSKNINPFFTTNGKLTFLERLDSTLRLTGKDASISIYKFKNEFNKLLFDSVTVLTTQNNLVDYIYPQEYLWTLPIGVYTANFEEGSYVLFSLYEENESNMPCTEISNVQYLFYRDVSNHKLKLLSETKRREEGFSFYPCYSSPPLLQESSISNAMLTDIGQGVVILYRRVKKQTQFYSSKPLKYLRTLKYFDARGDSVSATIVLDSVEASFNDLSDKVVLGKNKSCFIISSRFSHDTLFFEQFDSNGSRLQQPKFLLNQIRFNIDLKSHYNAMVKLDTMPRLRKADYQILQLNDGRFICAWSKVESDSTTNIFAGLLEENMNWLGSPKRINSDTTGNQYSPCIAVKGDTVFVAWLDTRNGERHVYMRRFRADQITDVKQEETQPTQFAIQEIFPNPFRESTTIRFSIPVETLHATSLRAYDLLGREVKMLFEGEAESGLHTVQFNAENLPNGVYQVVLQSGSKVEKRNIVLLK